MNAEEAAWAVERALPAVAHLLYADAYARLLEERGAPLPPRSRIEQAVPRADAVSVPLARALLDRIGAAWGVSVAEVVAAAGLTDEADVEHALSDLVLGCVGHGVTLDDDFEAARKRAEAVLGRTLDPVPVREEGMEFWEAACETMERRIDRPLVAREGVCSASRDGLR